MKFLENGERQLAGLSENRFYFALLTAMTALMTVYALNMSIVLHQNFMTMAGCDTAVLQSSVVNTLHGNWFHDNTFGGNVLGGHVTLITLLVAPVYALFPYPETLFVLQVCGVYSVVFPVYQIALELLKKPFTAFLVAGAALMSGILPHMAMSPVHYETWIGAAVLWSCYFYLRNRPICYWASFLFAVCCCESAAVIYTVLGAALLLTNDGLAWRKRYGFWTLAAGLAWLAITVEVIEPVMTSGEPGGQFAYHYSDWDIHSGSGLVMTVLEHPLQALAKMLNPDHWFSVGILVGLPLLFALFSWRSLLLLAVSPLYFLMNDGQFILPFHAYFHQYAFVAGYIGLVLFLARHDISTRIGTTVIISVLLVNFLCSISSFGIYSGLWTGRDKAYKTQVEAFAKIPRDAGVYGPHRFSEFLSNRQIMIMGDMHDEDFDLDRVINAKYNLTHVLPGQIDYIVCDVLSDQCGWRKNGYSPDYTKIRGKNLDRLILSGKWKLIFDEEGVVILHRVGS